MAQITIAGLGSATSVSNSDVLPVVASNVTKKITVGDLSKAVTASIQADFTASYATLASNANTASLANSATSASVAMTASLAYVAISGSYSDNANQANIALSIQGGQVTGSVSSSFTASFLSTTASHAFSASVLNSTASHAYSASYLIGNSVSASYVSGTNVDGYVLGAFSASLAQAAVSASYISASNVNGAVSASLTASVATTASFALTASYFNTAILAITGVNYFQGNQSITGSLAQGNASKAPTNFSTALGLGNLTDTINQTVVGQYNAAASGALFVVGNGVNSANKSNAIEVYSGKLVVSSSIQMILAPTTVPASPESGSLYFDSASGHFLGYTGKTPSGWSQLS